MRCLAVMLGAALTAAAPCADPGASFGIRLVKTTSDASLLSAAVDCEGGAFRAVWDGKVRLEVPIVVGKGTSLSITSRNDAIVNGGSKVQLFEAFGDLKLTGLKLLRGTAEFGGAIWASKASNITVSNCTFAENVAEEQGGAIFLTKGSSLRVARTKFSENKAVLDQGGAIWVLGKAKLDNSTFDRSVVHASLKCPLYVLHAMTLSDFDHALLEALNRSARVHSTLRQAAASSCD
jgi:predicted outer membrane repeat protein